MNSISFLVKSDSIKI